ncbi:MAG TPA: hypothetical protein VE991_06205 [Acidimicrobiales bacterium]|nr:hypothetical protein [Acidimicrobiales bacterium]
MVFGAHVVLFSTDPDADRRFLTEVMGLDSVDAGGGWLVYGLPPAELAVHPADGPGAGLYFMCDDLPTEMARLSALGITCAAPEEARWGSVTAVPLPSGATVGLYEPRHPTMVER